jgi:hypothetical protein
MWVKAKGTGLFVSTNAILERVQPFSVTFVGLLIVKLCTCKNSNNTFVAILGVLMYHNLGK